MKTKNTQKGSATLWIIIAVVIIFAAGGYYLLSQHSVENGGVNTVTAASSASGNQAAPAPVPSSSPSASSGNLNCQTYRLSTTDVTSALGISDLTEVSAVSESNVGDPVRGCSQGWTSAEGINVRLAVNPPYVANGKVIAPVIRNDVNGPCSVSAPALGIGDDSCVDRAVSDGNDYFVFVKGTLFGTIIVNLQLGSKNVQLPSKQQVVNMGMAYVAKMTQR